MTVLSVKEVIDLVLLQAVNVLLDSMMMELMQTANLVQINVVLVVDQPIIVILAVMHPDQAPLTVFVQILNIMMMEFKLPVKFAVINVMDVVVPLIIVMLVVILVEEEQVVTV